MLSMSNVVLWYTVQMFIKYNQLKYSRNSDLLYV